MKIREKKRRTNTRRRKSAQIKVGTHAEEVGRGGRKEGFKEEHTQGEGPQPLEQQSTEKTRGTRWYIHIALVGLGRLALCT